MKIYWTEFFVTVLIICICFGIGALIGNAIISDEDLQFHNETITVIDKYYNYDAFNEYNIVKCQYHGEHYVTWDEDYQKMIINGTYNVSVAPNGDIVEVF